MASDIVELYERIWKKADELAAKEVIEDTTVATSRIHKLTKDERRQRHTLAMLSLAMDSSGE